VTATSDPLETMEKLKADPYAFDLIITDMTMPQITGDQLAREARRYQNHPVYRL
jgi:CheY-like chemotaxis protein